jgi:hypothetical protein
MDWAGLRRALNAAHAGDLQTLERIDHALRDAQQAMDALAALGHRFWLTRTPQPAMPHWPRMLFHVNSAPNGRIVRSEFEAADLGPGWFDTLEAAQHWDGVETQFAGRGGVPRTSLPATMGLDAATIALQAQQAAKAKAQAIAEFKAARGAQHGADSSNNERN